MVSEISETFLFPNQQNVTFQDSDSVNISWTMKDLDNHNALFLIYYLEKPSGIAIGRPQLPSTRVQS